MCNREGGESGDTSSDDEGVDEGAARVVDGDASEDSDAEQLGLGDSGANPFGALTLSAQLYTIRQGLRVCDSLNCCTRRHLNLCVCSGTRPMQKSPIHT